ncbi:ATP-binding protein [Bacillus sp. FJAT-26390]|uniref:ATP-binding protein n=1 Tax=Bacillus sp. FJAT-26390 TaxID=1743142 RepID=UPI000807BABD|nr:ATP-binding protein [Bacillus sp. FJAT-26390]OBZ17487.1 hypothetical protein A7975_06380 [Bacillus sp. FJAT-26390]
MLLIRHYLQNRWLAPAVFLYFPSTAGGEAWHLKPLQRRHAIGLLNTDRRLKQMYGKGLQIVSTPDQGTTVSFIIPNKSANNKESDRSL